MDTAHRRMEIISILSVKGHITARELAWELGVTIRTIHHDIFALTFDYPIYTKPGCGGGVFITDNYKPYTNTLTETELETLCRIVELLDRLCVEEQWKPVGTGMELNIEVIKYKLLYPREYRLFKVAEMLMSDVIPQEMKDNVLEKMDKSIFSAYKQLSKVDVMDNIGRSVEEDLEDAIERYLKKE